MIATTDRALVVIRVTRGYLAANVAGTTIRRRRVLWLVNPDALEHAVIADEIVVFHHAAGFLIAGRSLTGKASGAFKIAGRTW
jgi:hypothetical protein